jgi:hypothetical protein
MHAAPSIKIRRSRPALIGVLTFFLFMHGSPRNTPADAGTLEFRITLM